MGLSVRRIVTYIIFAILVDRVARFIYKCGYHKNIYTHHPGQCRELKGIVNGSEDIVVASNGLAFISSGALMMLEPDAGIVGQIFLFDFNDPDRDPQDIAVTGIDTATWFPVGMDIWESGPKDDPKLTLYVVNKQPDKLGIEVFDFSFSKKIPTLTHLRRVQHKNIWSPNDVVVVDEHRFYTSNDVYLPRPFDVLQFLFHLHWGTIAYYDGQEARIVGGGKIMSNGINLSADKKWLYSADSFGHRIFIYRIESDGSLEQAKVISLSTVPDNINVDREDGSLWIGTQPLLHTFYNQGGRVNGVGQVLNIKLDENLNPTIREVFADDTGMIRSSSVACRHGNAMLIGTVVDKAAYCELKSY